MTAKDKGIEYDNAYARIVELVNSDNAAEYVDELRRMAGDGHVVSMQLLAVLLGDIDSGKYREEIIMCCEKAHLLGSSIAAEILAIQYKQWNEPFMSKLWCSRVPESERD
jgi:hypothetical protein